MASTSDVFLADLYEDLDAGRLLLPTLPEIALQVRDTLENPESSPAEAIAVISRDAALAARLIHVANSSLMRVSRPVQNLESAVTRLGNNMVRSLVVAMAMEQLFQASSDVTDRRLRELWQHALEVANLAQALAATARLRADQALLAGLLHDIGTLPILTRAEDYPELLHDEAALNEVIAQAHAQIGAAILRKWELPSDIVNAVLAHENLDHDGGPQPDYTDLLIVANLASARNQEQVKAADLPPSFVKLGMERGVTEIAMDRVLVLK